MFLFRPASTRQIDIALMILRVVVGVIFVAHGGQKLFVYGFDGVAGAFGQMGIPMPQLMGPFVALLEFGGGLALIAGFLTRLVALGLGATMAVAMLMVHLKGGFFAPNGIEFTLSLLGSAMTLAITGAGSFSIDTLIGRRRGLSVGSGSATIRRAA